MSTLQARAFHGGDAGAAAQQFGGDPASWLDLSTGINPVPYPFDDVPSHLWTELPSAHTETRLREVGATYFAAAGPDWVVPSPGTQMLIQWLPFLRAPGRVLVVTPTYGEHAPAWQRAGHQVTTASRNILDDVRVLDSTDVVVIVNPNNPDGAVLRPEHLLALAERLAARKGWLVVDEAFVDPTPSLSLVRAGMPANAIVLRSFGKFFGLAGARLGFAVAHPSLARSIEDALGRWAVPGPVAHIGATAMADTDWIEAATSRIAADTGRLDTVLTAHGLTVIGGTTLFRLAASANAPRIHDALAGQQILVRRFPAFPQWLRFGVPASASTLERLATALATT